MDFNGQVYTSTDGKFKIDLDSLHLNTWLNVFAKVAAHVYGNEAISKASTARAKNPDLPESEYEAIKLTAREGYLASMIAGTWGEGQRGPRMPAANRLEQIQNNLAAEDTRKAIAKAGWKPGEAKDTWLHPEAGVVKLADCMQSYLDNEEFGPERKASIAQRAKVKHDAELADAALRKEAKERESKVTKGAGLGL